MEPKYYPASPPPPAQAKPNYLPIIVIALMAWLFVQFQNHHWPFEQYHDQQHSVIDNTPTPAPVIDDNAKPKPEPTPAPTPVTKQIDWLIVVDETENRPADRQFIFNDYGFWFEELPAAGIRHRFFDQQDAAAESFLYRAEASGVDPPFVMATGEAGDVVGVIPFPNGSTVEPIRALLGNGKKQNGE